MILTLMIALSPLPVTLLAAVMKSRTRKTNKASLYLMWAMILYSTLLVTNIVAVAVNTQRIGPPYILDAINHVVLIAGSFLLYETNVAVAFGDGVNTRHRRIRQWLYVLAGIGSLVTFVLARQEATGQLLTEAGAKNPWILAHWVFIVVCMLWVLTTLGVQDAWLFPRSAPGPARTGLAMMIIGTILGDLYYIHKVYYLASRYIGHDHGLFIDKFSEVGVAIFVPSLLLCSLGSFWPDVRALPGVQDALDLLARWRLRNLRAAVTAAGAQSAPHPAGGHAGILYRHIVEIMDALLALSVCIDEPTLRAIRSGCSGARTPAEREALVLATCIQVARRIHEGALTPTGPPADITLPAGEGLWSQFDALRQVARALPAAARIAAGLPLGVQEVSR